MRFYKLIYYNLYLWYKNNFPKETDNYHSPILIMSLLFVQITAVLLILFNFVFGVSIALPVNNRGLAILPIAGIYFFHYYLFIFQKKYKNIYSSCNKLDSKVLKKSKRYTLSYVVLTNVLFFIFMMYLGISNYK